MSGIDAFLTQLRQKGVKINVVEGNLKIGAPKGALTPTLVKELKARKQEMLTFLMQAKKVASAAKNPPIPTVARSGEIPLSFPQERMWFLFQLIDENAQDPAAEAALYNLPFVVRMDGDLDVSALERALAEILARHESLRTTFAAGEDGPIQVFHPPGAFQLTLHDLSTVTPGERNARRDALIAEDASAPFNLETGPLLRAALVRMTGQEHLLLLNMHHIVSDGWSLGVFLVEAGALYRAFSAGKPATLPPLPIQYADFSVWQRKHLSGKNLDTLVSYWRKKLACDFEPLELPTDFTRPRVFSNDGDTHVFSISESESQALQAVCKATGNTMFMAMQAVFKTLLFRYTRTTDLLMGSPIANRSLRELEPLIGFFVNTLVMRDQVDAALSFNQLLARVKDTVLGAFAHQDLPFEKLVEELQPERDMSRTPIFQVMFTLQNFANESIKLPNLTIAPLEQESRVAKFDLTFTITEEDGGFRCLLNYGTRLFKAQSIARMAEHFRRLVVLLGANPEQRLGDCDYLSKEEHQRNLVTWNQSARTYPSHRGIHQLFEERARETPHKTALEIARIEEGDPVRHLTYEQLNQAANLMALHLINRGVRVGDLVGLCAERSFDAVIGMLAVFKSGGAFVPLDPGLPKERLSFIMNDTDIRSMVVQRDMLEKIPAFHGDVLFFEDVPQCGEAPEISRPTGDNFPAYVMYTSGSTGVPKGVLTPHRGIVRLAHELNRPVNANSVVIHMATIAFDGSSFEIWMPLLNGGRAVVFQDPVPTPKKIRAMVRNHGVNTAFMTTALFNLIMDEAPDTFQNFYRLDTGGEAMSMAHIRKARELMPDLPVFNVYGPTECTVYVSSHTIPSTIPADAPSMPIGRPLANIQLHVLDDRLRETPVGITGELHAGGDGIAHGYLKRPDLTAEKFVPDPFSPLPGSRLYKTGDLVRRLSEGEIDFVGRTDHQVKIRGFRIELGEIESALMALDEVENAMVLARQDQPGEKRLVGYLVPKLEPDRVAAIVEGLRRNLPAFMIPTALLSMEAFPLTPNGKVAVRKLPAPESEIAMDLFEAPSGATEEALVEIFQDLLSLEKCGVTHSFFELGGHSLMATRLISRIRDGLGVELPLRVLFEAPTIRQLAPRVEAAQRQGSGIQSPPFVRVPRDQPARLSFPQQRLWFLDSLEPGSAFYNMPSHLEIAGELNGDVLEKALAAVCDRHESLRTTFQHTDDGPIQVVSPSAGLTLERVDLSNLPSETRTARAKQIADEDIRKPFDLEVGPLFRAVLVRLDADTHHLLLNMHHVISDGWSLDILLRETVTLYHAFANHRPSPLPQLDFQYRDYAEWQRNWLQGDVLSSYVDHWHEVLGDEPPVVELHTDHPRPPMQTYTGRTDFFQMDAPVLDRLKALNHDTGCTEFMITLAAFNILLKRYSGKDDILIGTPIANRNRAEIEPLIGFFVNTLVLRSDTSGNPTFHDYLDRVRAATLDAYAWADMPFEKLVEEIQSDRDLSRSPLFQIMFTFQNLPSGAVETPGLRFKPLPQPYDSSKFDLTLGLEEMDGVLHGHVEYNTDLFEPTTLTRFINHYRNLLTQALDNPQVPLNTLDPLSAEERTRLLTTWNPSADTVPELTHRLFEARADAQPHAPAVVMDDQSVTYGELNRAANRIASDLAARGVGPQQTVGVFMDRSPEFVAGLLGILKAGGVYVPLDPAYPEDRLTFMIGDINPRVVLTSAQHEPRVGSHALVISDLFLSSQSANHNPVSSPDPDNTAYIIYTSGSTGQPKGVTVPHHALAAQCRAWSAYQGIDARSRVLCFASFNFDVSLEQLLPGLTVGACIQLCGTQPPTPEALVRLIPETGLTHMDLTPSYWVHFVQEWTHPLDPNHPPQIGALKRCSLGGEAMPVEGVRAWMNSSLADVALVNAYGPTETAITSSAFVMEAGYQVGAVVPIGKGIGARTNYILDKHAQLTPVGAPGELHTGGPLLASGYLRRPDLTAERFVPDPFSQTPGARMYRTGDLVRHQINGNIEFLGRVDHQVKIRGFRIELGEVETVLASHEQVVESHAAALDGRLVTWFVSSDPPTPADLRNFMKARLPDYMVPSVMTPMTAFPLTPTGKVDRKALPKPDATQLQDTVFTAPEGPLEELIASIWGSLLDLPRIGRDGNFFELGGHSLLATQTASRIRRAIHVELPLRLLFEAPTVAALAREIEQLQRRADHLDRPRIEPRRHSGPAPLSFAQQRLWFLYQYEPESAVYNMPAAIRFKGNLQADLLHKALAFLVERHDSLRTTFEEGDAGPVQVVHPHMEAPFQVVDLSQHPAAGREAELAQTISNETAHIFNLTKGPLFRALLVKTDGNEHAFMVNMHHIISDGWSMDVFIRELTGVYLQLQSGAQADLPPLPIQYTDFAVWQREYLEGEVLDQQSKWWRERFPEPPPPLDIPVDFPRPAVQTYHGALYEFDIAVPLEPLRNLSKSENATLFMTLLTAFNVLLHRHTGQTQFAVGTPIANRNAAELEPLIGFFVNTLVLDADLNGNPTFRELLGAVRDTTLGAYAHQDLPFEKLVEELQPERDLSRPPLFQVIFSLQNQGDTEFNLPGLSVAPLDLGNRTAKFELNLTLLEDGDRLLAGIEYNTDLFKPTTIHGLSQRFANLLNAVAAAPELPIGAYDILNSEERRRVIHTWNDTAVDHPGTTPVHRLFEAVAAAHPDSVALEVAETDPDQTSGSVMTYAQLNQRADQLAAVLRTCGVDAEHMVGLMLDRSFDAVAAMLAVLKTGAAFVPLDPAYPADRLAYMIEDTAVHVIITRSQHLTDLPETDAHKMLLDQPLAQVQPASSADTGDHHSAYVMYTSGSTGRPKGVLIPHRAIVRLVFGSIAMDSDTRVLQMAPIAFDAATLEIWGPLLHGGRCILYADRVPTAEKIALAVKRCRVNFMWVTASLFNMVIDQDPTAFMGVDRLYSGGEALSVGHIRRACQHLPETQILNGYGPTESTTFACTYPIPGVPATDQISIPIGPPIANTTVYLVDAYMNPVAVGAAGELLIGGMGLARGYLNQPAMTAEKFIPNPFAELPGERLYRTGDQARFLPDGAVDFLGRVDHQVKIRGFRIEPGEVEATLAEHDALKNVHVLVREDIPGDKRLAAYLVATNADADPPNLKDWMAERVPAHMIPSNFIFMDVFPITANGKIDRRALPTPEDGTPTGELTAPSTPTEETLAEHFCSVLHLTAVGVTNSFFDLGGHSLLATRLLSAVNQHFNLDLPLRAVFENPTIQQLALLVDQADEAVALPTITPVPRTEPLPLSFAQRRLWFIQQMEPDTVAYNMPYAFRLTGQTDVNALADAVSSVVARQESLRTTFGDINGEPVQIIGHAPFHPARLDLSQLSNQARETRIQELVQAEAVHLFNLETGPLFQATIAICGVDEHLLIINMHHIVSDGWSMDLFLQEMAAFYHAAVNQEPSPLTDLVIQYADFAAWQNRLLTGELLERWTNYWKTRLAGFPAALELVTDFPRPPVQTQSGATVTFTVPAKDKDAMAALCHQGGATLFMGFLTVWKTLLYHYTGNSDLIVGTPIANRNHREIEPLIGFFVNTLALRTDVDPSLPFQALLDQVRNTTLEAYDHQDLPFEKLVEELQPERDLSRSPIFQVMFTLQSAATSSPHLPGVTLTPLNFQETYAKFDLMIGLSETNSGQLAGHLNYNTDLFTETTIQRMSTRFLTLLGELLSHPDRAVGRASLIEADERHRLLVDFNNDRVEFPPAQPLIRLFETQAAQQPDADALVDDERTWTYGQLNQRADALAGRLRHMGVGPGTRAALCFGRSHEYVVSILAIVKCGAAYVPIDPAYPEDRMIYVLKDSDAVVLLSTPERADGLPVPLVQPADHYNHEPAPPTTISADFPVYIIYTSGSTGRPKGVEIRHLTPWNLIHWNTQAFQTSAADRTCLVAGPAFDVSVWELWSFLAVGAALYIPDDDTRVQPDQLRDYFVNNRITISFVPTPLAQEMILLSWPEDTALRILQTAGDKLQLRPPQGLPFQFINNYGPTEATVLATTGRVEPGSNQSTPSIGRSLTNVRLHVLDRAMQVSPLGVPGELFIGGNCLSSGYWRRPELTAVAFVPDPFSDEPGARLYRSGDLVRYNDHGNLDFLGRIDHQVKIRGFRIELGEIEALLAAQPNLKQVHVTVREDQPGDKRLVAYIVFQDPTQTPPDLKAALSDHLPDFMVPSAFVFLPEFPLTPNGKVDRRALPAPEIQTVFGDLVPPRSPMEHILADHFRDILNVQEVGVTNSFFDMGGHSLLAARLISAVKQSFDVAIPLRLIFENPTVAQLADILEHTDKSDATTPPAITPVPRDTPLPLSFAQQRLWFINQLEPENTTYNMPMAFQMDGAIQDESLEWALHAVVERHESLRTTFSMAGREPVQVVGEANFVLDRVDLHNNAPEQQQAQVQTLINQEALRQFDICAGPLLHATLITLNPNQCVLLINMHHIISDGWSMDVFIREVGLLYEAHRNQKPTPLPPLDIQYADFAVWQRRWLDGEVLQQQLDYWQNQLAGCPAALELATDFQRPPVQTQAGAIIQFQMDESVKQQMNDLCRNHAATLFMGMFAAWKILLFRYTRQTDLVVGTLVANRNHVEIEPLIGFFVNTLALRTHIHPDDNFNQIVDRVRHATLQAYAHQDLPFEKLVEKIQPTRDMSRSPIFQALFTLRSTHTQALDLPDLKLTPLDHAETQAKFDLMMTLGDQPDGTLLGDLNYNTDLFTQTTMMRMSQRFVTLVNQLLADPERAVGQVPLIEADERTRLLKDFNSDQIEVPPAQPIHRLFENQAAQQPTAIALADDIRTWTYEELNRRADALAGRLQKLGVAPGARAALCFHRSHEFVVSILAIVKCGAAYVPIDPAYPKDRLLYVLEDSEALVLLTTPDHVSEAPVPLIQPNDHYDHAPAAPTPITADYPAYIIYTSGSTGRPKGVEIRHLTPWNLIHWNTRVFKTTPADRTCLVAGPAFDVSVWELWSYLAVGASLHIPDEDTRIQPNRLRDYFVTNRITISFVPTPIAQEMILLPWPEDTALRYLQTAGDKLQLRPPAGLPFRFVNNYGPTEATVLATTGLVEPGSNRSTPTIGHALTNVRLYILDPAMQPTPLGVPGELFIGGHCLSPGYWRRPELTGAAFVPDPFSEDPGARLYRSGDLVRYADNGDIHFLGRIDHQVKIRGFRIELGEIEALLATTPNLKQVHVAVREDQPGDKRLVAYTVLEDPDQSPADFKGVLRENLPDYMVPSAFVVLPEFPLTPNGKIDRRALPAPEADSALGEIVQPRTPIEHTLLDLYRDLLGVQAIGVTNSFFDMGGHSLLATRLISAIKQSFDVDIPLRLLFENPSAAELASQIEQAEDSGQKPPPIIPVSRDQPLPLSFAQQRLWFIEKLEPANTAYNMPMGFTIQGDLQKDALDEAVRALVERHEILRTTFSTAGDRGVQIIHDHIDISVTHVDLTNQSEQARSEHIRAAIQQEFEFQFNLQKGPLFRVALFRQTGETHTLLLNMHHIISDGWSLNLIMAEISLLYNATVNGKSNPLPALEVQYADFAVWQQQWLSGAVLEDQLSYWKNQLAGFPATLELATDYSRPPIQTQSGDTHQFVLDPSLGPAIEARRSQTNATGFMVLMTAWQILLHQYSDQDDIIVGTVIANRNHREIEPLIGFFVNTLAIRTQVTGSATFDQLIEQVRVNTLNAYSHQDLPFERLIAELQVERDLSRSPLFQVLFTMTPSTTTEADLAGLSLTPIDSGGEQAKFDLTLAVSEGADGSFRAGLNYNTDLFKPQTIQTMANRFNTLLLGLTANPNLPVGRIDILTDDERIRLLETYNNTARDYPLAQPVHHLFESHAATFPSAIALEEDSRKWTFSQLNDSANRLAAHLRSLGIGPGNTAALCYPRSSDQVISVLAIVKTGAAYVPIDPAYPEDRLRYILEDSQAAVLLAPQPIENQKIPLAQPGDHHPPAPAGQTTITAAFPMYLIYTSGSTGRPKGVIIRHFNLWNLCCQQKETYDVRPNDRTALVAGPAFDASVWELWANLIFGVTICIPSEEVRLHPERLAEWLYQQKITHVFTPTPLAQELIIRPWPADTKLRHLHTGGDKLQIRPNVNLPFKLINNYGPTESTVLVTAGEVGPGDNASAPSIGSAIPNTQLYILNDQMQPVPHGAPGELVIAGAGLASGYNNRADLTAAAFIPNPFGANGERLYKTGDRVRYDANGQIEFLGRADHQVKIRGFRIELGEIEAILAEHPDLKNIHVNVRTDHDGRKQLVAYLLVADDDTRPDLKAMLRERLPDYMVPAAFVFMTRFPITPNGKLDRRALPEPNFENSRTAYIAPRTPLEATLAAIWEEVLDRPSVSMTDNFFDLGGHSMKAVQLVTAVKAATGKEIPLAALFERPTIEGIAQLAADDTLGLPQSPLITIQGKGSKPPVYWVHPVGGNVMCYRELSLALGDDQPFFAFQSPTLSGGQGFDSLKQAAAFYIKNLRQAQPMGPYHLAGWSFGGLVAFEMAVQLGEAVERLILVDSYAPKALNLDTLDERSVIEAFANDAAATAGLPEFRLPERGDPFQVLIDTAVTTGLVPRNGGAAAVQRLYQTYNQNLTAMAQYELGEFAGEMTLIRPSESMLDLESQVQPFREQVAKLDIQSLEGGHYSVLKCPGVDILAGLTREILASKPIT